MKRRVLTMLLALIAAICLFTVTASAEEIASGTCGEGLTWVLTNDGTLTISGTGAMADYAGGLDEDYGGFYSTAPWYAYHHQIRQLELKAGVTTIGSYAFFNCSKLNGVSMANTIRSIGDYAFNYCGDFEVEEGEGFRKLLIPEGVAHIGNYAFLRCYNLEQVTLPNTLKTVGKGAFCYTDLTSVEIPASLEVIPEDMFLEVRSLDYITLHEGLKRIEDGAFAYCSPDIMVIPSTVEYIGSVAFSWCTPLEYFVIYSKNWECGDWEDGIYYPYGIEWNTDFYGYAGSTTEAYAANMGFDFYEIPLFRDIYGDDFYFAPVTWAVANNITAGVSATAFAPDDACNRAQVVTFLWRAAGEPEPTTSTNPFVDVKKGSFYEKAVLWAVEKDITAGTDATHFSPNKACNRAQVVTFLHRAFGNPAAGGENPFTDVPAGSWYTAPVLWAVETGITAGMGGSIFGVNNPCNRAQIVTFLYRAYN